MSASPRVGLDFCKFVQEGMRVDYAFSDVLFKHLDRHYQASQRIVDLVGNFAGERSDEAHLF